MVIHGYSKLLLFVTLLLTGVMLFTTVGCSDKALQTTAKASRDVAAANLALSSTLIQAAQSGALTDEYVRPILQVSLQVAQAGKQVDAAIAGISQLSPADRTKILAIIQPVIASLNTAVSQTALIKNDTIKTEVMAALTTIQAALASVRVAMGS